MKTMMFLIFFFYGLNSFAEVNELDKILEQARARSLAGKAASESLEASRIEARRSEKHWLPKIYLSGQSYLSNDPANALFGKLLQRKIENNDFRSELLNQPGTDLYNKVTVGLDMPLFEGGQKTALQKAAFFKSLASEKESVDIEREFRNEIVRSYLEGSVLMIHKKELGQVSSIIDSTLKKYVIGRKENQLGHSGLLGFKSLKNKIEALLLENSARMISITNALTELAGPLADPQFIEEKQIFTLIDQYLSYSKENFVKSAKTEAVFESARSAHEYISAEKSRHLPRIGLFGEGSAFKADRGLGKGFSAGLYLSWNLYSYNDYGTSTEAVHKASSAQYYAEALLQKEKIEYIGLKESLNSIKKSLELLEKSEEQLSEQTNISKDLFKNGLINALQYAEVLNRRIDLIQSKNMTRNQLLSVQSQLSKFQAIQPGPGENRE